MARDLSRREFLANSTALAASVCAANAIGGCSDAGQASRLHSAATFDVAEDSAILWGTAPVPDRATLQIEDEQGLAVVGADAAQLEASAVTGLTASLPVVGLAAGAIYRWRLHWELGPTTPWLEFRTAPARDSAMPVRFVASGDVGWDVDLNQVFDRLANERADFYLSLGDWPYCDTEPAAFSLDEYRAKHRAARSAPRVPEFLVTTPLHAIHDDHEIRDNCDGSTDRARMTTGGNAWREWFPARAGPDHYQRVRWGKLVELFLLDTRCHRSANSAFDGPRKTMLGEQQLAWLLAGLGESDAAFKIVASSVPFDHGTTGADSWIGFMDERARVLAAIGDAGADRTLILSADQHWFSANRHAPDDVVEYQIGSLTAGLRSPPAEVGPGVIARERAHNYAEIEVVPGPPARLQFRCRDAQGRLLFEQSHEPR